MSLSQAALAEWRRAIGDEHVDTDAGGLAAASTTTYATHARGVAILRPADVGQVQACVRIAARHGAVLHPYSTGKNWGYGSRVPTFDGAVLLDLSRLDRILDYDEELCCVSVEPGVTQDGLHAFLRQRGGRLWMDGTGSTPDASPLGNTMERGFGLTAYGDHVGRASAYQVVLADGSLLHTGYGAYPGARTAAVDRWSPGPQLDGLFSQSNLGVVTRLTLPLMPAPEAAVMLVADLPDEARLAAVIDTMRDLQLDGTLRAAPWFGNHYRLLGTVMRFPWHRAAPPLRPEQCREIAVEHGLAPWTCFTALYGSAEQVAASRRRVEESLRPLAVGLEAADAVSLATQPHSARRSIHLSMYRAYTGGILNAARRAYWRKTTPVDAEVDPDRDGVGFIFVNASLPFRGGDIVEAQRIAEEVILEAGFEPSFSCHSIRERVLQGLSTFAWDRAVAGDDDRAIQAHDRLSALWAERGWYPFRLGLHSMHLLERAEDTHRRTVAAIRGALDPEGRIAPGHYA